MELKSYQKRVVDDFPKQTGVWYPPGRGKSIIALALLEKASVKGLIICPKSVKEKWSDEMRKFGSSFFHDVMTKEEFRRDWKKVPRYEAVVYDEAHYVFGMKSTMSKSFRAWKKYHQPYYFWALTATPYLSTPWNVYVLEIIMGENPNYMFYRHEYFDEINMGGRIIPKIKSDAKEKLAKRIAELGYVLTEDERHEFPDPVEKYEYFDLTSKQNKAIKKIDSLLPITRYTQTHQIAQGVLKGDEYVDRQQYPSEKMNRIVELCQNNSKVAVVCRYNAQIDVLREKLKTKKNVYVISGQESEREETITKANHDSSCVVLIQADVSEGFEIPTFSLCLFASVSFSYKNFYQMKGRFQREHEKNPGLVFVYMVCRDGFDDKILDTLSRGEDFYFELYNQ